MTGTFYGLGIGPGDPDLITVKARDILARVPVIAYPAPEGGTSLVRAIADKHIPAGRQEVVIATPMAVERFPAQEVYDRYAEILGTHLAAGRGVAVLCEGDPFLYGSFMYLFERIAERFPTIVVPGVSSLGAVAAAAGTPLASRNEVFTILPATLSEIELTARLTTTDTAAIIKVGRHLAKVKRVLSRLGLLVAARYVERATMANERVSPLTAVSEANAPYFSMIVVKNSRTLKPAIDRIPDGAAIVALTAGGAELAQRLKPLLPNACVHGLAGRVADADTTFGDTISHLRALFAAGTPIIAICAAGIVIRALAPLLIDKHREPPVLALAEDGSVVVPLLGGHHGGNRLAHVVARAFGGVAAITTAGDLTLGVGLDDPPAGWRVANPDKAKAIAAALLAGLPVALAVEVGNADWLAGIPFADTGEHRVRVTDRAIVGYAAAPPDGRIELILHPPILALGVGCERGCSPAEVIALVEETLAAHGLAMGAVACVCSLDLKADEAAMHALAAHLGAPVRFFTADELERETQRLQNPSDVVFREVGCHGVSEAAALAAAGADSALIVAKTRSRRATCAVARSVRPIDALAVGQAPGQITVVGIGPGAAAWRTPEATRALAEATDVVGYQLYLDLLGDLLTSQRLHTTPLSAEEDRVRLALDLAAQGRRVALVSSGDAGIYALAALTFELLDRENRPQWNRLAISVAPGISALQAAAARIGAPLGHDFCAISLSDLLTPWPTIEGRIAAAAAGDFVVALYNPVSQRRRSQLLLARDILLMHRPAETPVVLARNLGRDDERIEVIRLAELTPNHADMLTVILIGSSQTKLIERGSGRFVYTPRGYTAKRDGGDNSREAAE